MLESHYQNKYNKTVSKGKKFNDPPTDSQIQVLRLLADGLSYEDIASKMFISVSIVKSNISVLYGKLHVNNRAEAIKKGSMLGYLDYASVVNEGWKADDIEKIKSDIVDS